MDNPPTPAEIVARDERIFQVRIWPLSGSWSWQVMEQTPDQRGEIGSGSICMTRLDARLAARHAIRLALKGEESWTVRATRKR